MGFFFEYKLVLKKIVGSYRERKRILQNIQGHLPTADVRQQQRTPNAEAIWEVGLTQTFTITPKKGYPSLRPGIFALNVVLWLFNSADKFYIRNTLFKKALSPWRDFSVNY